MQIGILKPLAIGLALCAGAGAAPAGAQPGTALAAVATSRAPDLAGRSGNLVRIAGENQRELQKLRAEHESKIRKLEEELLEKIEKAEAELGREAAIEEKADQLHEKRVQFRHKTDEAYATYDRKLAEETRRYREKRAQLADK